MPDLGTRATFSCRRSGLVLFALLFTACGEEQLAPEPTQFETIISGPAGIGLSGELFECFRLVGGHPLALASTLQGVTDGTPDRHQSTPAASDIAEVLGVHLRVTKTSGEGVLQAEIRRDAESVIDAFASDAGDEIDISAGDPGRC